MTKPPRPSAIPRIPMRYTAEIETHDGWFFHYTVHRLWGFGIPENSTSQHRTLKAARRAAHRWTRRNGSEPTIVERIA